METAVKKELKYANRMFGLRSDWVAMTVVVSAGEAVAVIRRLFEGDNRFDYVAIQYELEQWDRDNHCGNNEFIVAFSRAVGSSKTMVEIVSVIDAEYILFSRKVAGWQLQRLVDSEEYNSDNEFEEVFAGKFVGNAGRLILGY